MRPYSNNHDDLGHRDLLVTAEITFVIAKIPVVDTGVVVVHVNQEADTKARDANIAKLNQAQEV